MKRRLMMAGLLGLNAGIVFGGDLTADNVTAIKDSRVYGTLTVIQGAVSNNAAQMYYSFTHPSTNTVADESGQGNHGTLVGTSWSTNAPAGFPSGSQRFGSNEYINVTVGSGVKLTGPMTLSAWIMPTNDAPSGGNFGIIAKGATQNDGEYALGWENGVVLFNSNQNLLSSSNAVPKDVWTHVAGVLEGTGANQAKIYVNGQLVKQGNMGNPDGNSASALYVGRWRSGCPCDFKGFIDEPAIIASALSASEINQLYTSGIASFLPSTNVVLLADDEAVTIRRLRAQGDISMGVYTNGP